MRKVKSPSPAHSLREFTTSPTRGEVIFTDAKPSPLVGEGGPKDRVRGKKQTRYLSLFFSLGLHGALASFLLLPSQTVVEKSRFSVEVRWEGEAPSHAISSSPAQALRDRNSSPLGGEVIHTAETPSHQGERANRSTEKSSPLRADGSPKGRVRGIKQDQNSRYLSLLRAPVEGEVTQKVTKILDCHVANAPCNDVRINSSSRVRERLQNENEGLNNASLSVAKMPVLKKKGRVFHKPLPKYPWVCRKRGQEGRVSLLVQTNGEGYVVSVSLHKSSGHAALDQSAMSAVKAWIFADDASQKILSIAFHLKG